MIYCFDLDGTICTQEKDYKDAIPIRSIILKINKLHQQGHKIIFFTARGYVTKIDWRKVTEKQLKKWNVYYDELMFGKPNADYYIDDKAINVRDWK